VRTSSRPVAVVLFDEVELFDVAAVSGVLTTAGRQWNYRPFRVHPVAARAGMIDTRSQVRLEATTTLDGLTAPEIVVVPGGYGARRALSDAALVAWLRAAGRTATHFVGVGNGVLLLGAAGILPGVDVAVQHELKDALVEIAMECRPDTDSRFRQSGRVFTAAASGGAAEAALALVAALLGAKQGRTVADALGLPFSQPEAGQIAIVEK
jgi:transcriptional regulator GlxA family with amidase domain